MSVAHSRGQRGFTLVELMVAMSLGLALSWLVLDVYIKSSRAQAQLATAQQLNEAGQYLSGLLHAEISAAGFYGYTITGVEPQGLPPLPCQLLDRAASEAALAFAVTGVNDATSDINCRDQRTSINRRESSICTAQAVLTLRPAAGSDVVLLRRAAFQPALAEPSGMGVLRSALTNCQHYLAWNGDKPINMKFLSVDRSARDLVRKVIWVYLEDVFYITSAGEFRRIYLDEGLFKSSRTIAEGVEDLQIEYGVDDDGDAIVDQWLGQPGTAVQWGDVVAVNYYLRLVGDKPIAGQQPATFNYAGKSFTAPNDGLPRKLFSGSVRLASPAMRRAGQ
jgi:type IV pilus assembly protein PilW